MELVRRLVESLQRADNRNNNMRRPVVEGIILELLIFEASKSHLIFVLFFGGPLILRDMSTPTHTHTGEKATTARLPVSQTFRGMPQGPKPQETARCEWAARLFWSWYCPARKQGTCFPSKGDPLVRSMLVDRMGTKTNRSTHTQTYAHPIE